MKKRNVLLIFLLLAIFEISCKQAKIVTLMPVRNEARTIEVILRAAACYSDAMVILDDASEDTTVQILHNLVKELGIERIIEKKQWVRDEKGDRQKLLDAGREIGGTHFILLDADQMFSAECLHHDWLRKKILSLQPGQVLRAPIINLWGSIEKYRDDVQCNPYQQHWIQPFVMCDDGVCSYKDSKEVFGESGVIHIWKFPFSLRDLAYIDIPNLNHGVLHFKSINLEDVYFKRIWYMFLELIYLNKNKGCKSTPFGNAIKINNYYHFGYDGGEAAHDPKKAQCSPVKQSWYQYPFFSIQDFMEPDSLRKTDIERWINEFGMKYFAFLNIWDKPFFKRFIKEIGHIDTLRSVLELRAPYAEELKPTKKGNKRRRLKRVGNKTRRKRK